MSSRSRDPRRFDLPPVWTEDDDATGAGAWTAARTARLYLANMPAERRAMLEAEWSDEPRSCA